MIYLDNASTTFPKPEEVYKANDYCARNLAFNGGRGLYKVSSEATEIIESARKNISIIAGSYPEQVVFTHSATETLNMIVYGLNFEEGDNIYISPFEHNAIIRALYNLKRRININIVTIPFLRETWEVDYDELNNLFALNNPKCVMISHVSNATGYILPYESIFEISKKYSSINVLDCAQSFGLVKTNNKNIDILVFAGHKTLYSIFGVAGMINLSGVKIDNIFAGGNGADSLNINMPDTFIGKLEAGSKNINAIYTLLISSKWVIDNNPLEHEIHLINKLISKLKENDKVILYLPKNENIAGIISFNIKGYSAEDVGFILDNEFDICVRTGYHCAPLVHDFIGSKQYNGTIRVSLSAFTTEDEINEFVNAISTL